MDDVPEPPLTVEQIQKLVESRSSEPRLTTVEITDLIQRAEPRRYGSHFDALVEAIDWELRAQLAIGRIGRVDTTPRQIRDLAFLIADEVDWRFRLDPKLPPGQD